MMNWYTSLLYILMYLVMNIIDFVSICFED